MVSEKPGLIFKLGTKNDELGSNKELHHSDFLMDEESLQYGCKTMIQFVLDNHNGVDIEKIKASDERVKR